MKKLNRTNTNAFFPLVLFVTITFIAAYQLINNSPLAKVKKGTHELFCVFYSEQGIEGQRKVDKELIVDFVDSRWLFTNGSAKNCQLKKAVNVL